MKNKPVKEAIMSGCSATAWSLSTIFFIICYIENSRKNVFSSNTINLCLQNEISASTPSTILGLIVVTCFVVVILTAIIDVLLILTLKKSVSVEDTAYNLAIQDSIKVPTRATGLSSVKFVFLVVLTSISRLINVGPEVLR